MKQSFNSGFRMPKYTPLVAAVAVAAVIFAFMLAAYMRKKYIEKFSSNTTVTFFYMNGCPHCVDFEPEWDIFVANPPPGVSTEKHEAKEDITQKKGISGFPTIIITKDGKDITYPGARKAEALTKYIAGLP